jgi:transcriptional regulator with XRE-family HTH domain
MAVRAGMVLDRAVGAVAAQAGLWVSQSPMEAWGERVRRFRRRRRRKDGTAWTQEDLAHAASIDRRYIGRIETGEVLNPEPETVKKLSKALRVSMRELAEPLGWYDDGPAGHDLLAAAEAELEADTKIPEDLRDLAIGAIRLARKARQQPG